MFQSEIRLFFLKKTTWKQRPDFLASEKGLQLLKVITPPVITRLLWYGAVYSRPYFCVEQQQKFEYPVSYKAGTSKVPSWPKTHVPKWLLKWKLT